MLLEHRDLTRGDSPNRVPATSPQVPALLGALEPIWVSTDLRMWLPLDPSFIGKDCEIDDRCYRRLDPDYFAWLKLKMHEVKAAAEAGRVPEPTFDALRLRFNDIQDRAIEMFGEAKLLAAVRTLDVDKYRPPLPEEFERPMPVESRPRGTSSELHRLERARRLVDAIRDEALALGWSMDNLYFSDGYDRCPIGRYGLICYIRVEHRIGEVSRQSIELIGPPPLETRIRFYNRDVDQPWIRRVGPPKL